MNIFGISSIILAFVSIVFALILFIANRQSKIIRAWLYESIAISLWSLGLYGVTSSTNQYVATLWQYLLDFSAIFIPVLYVRFVSILLDLRNIIFVRLLMVLSFIVALFSFTSYFKLGVEMRYDFYWVIPGKLYMVFPIFFVTFTLLSVYLLCKVFYLNKKGSQLRKQSLILLIGYSIGSAGGITNFFPQLFNIYPYGNFIVIAYFFFMGYAIIKFEFLNTKAISTQLFSSAVVVVFLFNLLKSTALSEWALNFLMFLLALFFAFLLVNGVQKEIRQRIKIEELAKDLEKTNTSLEKANDRLKELDQLKSEFVSLATHQIRAPLTAIRGYISMLKEGDYGPVSSEVSGTLDIISDSANSLVTIVGDFLDVSRIEQGRMKYEMKDFDLNKLISQIVTEYQPNIEKKKLQFTFETDPHENYTMYGDPTKIKQIIGNIIDNSVKYTPKGSVKVTLTEREGKFLVKISDTGVGIPPQTIPKLFQKFTRAENANEANILGTGLGLYVAKQMVEAHKGRIWAESEGNNKGSQFYIEFPAKS